MNLLQRRMGATWLLIVVILASIEQNRSTMSDDDKEKVEKGVEVGQAILEFITDGEFTEALTKIGQSIGPFLGAFGPILSLILAFVPGSESEELTYMKDMMKKIDNKFNRVDSRFDEIERLIDWTKVAVNFGQIEQRIVAMDEEYKQLYNGTVPAANRKRIFITHFESVYQLSGVRLYNAIVQNQGTFQENLGESVMRYTKNDRKKTQIFLLGVMRLLLQAVKIELAYYNAAGFEVRAETTKENWETKILRVKSNFEQIDKTVMGRWQDQCLEDIKKYAADNNGMSNEDFKQGLSDVFNEKYYWRVWFVIVYRDVTGWDKHCISKCGGHHLFRQDGRNIVVGSKDAEAETLDLERAQTSLDTITCYGHTLDQNWEMANQVCQKINLNEMINMCGYAVIKRHINIDLWYSIDSNRMVWRWITCKGVWFWHQEYDIIVFG